MAINVQWIHLVRVTTIALPSKENDMNVELRRRLVGVLVAAPDAALGGAATSTYRDRVTRTMRVPEPIKL
jgi:hypothetical protein